MGNQRYELRCTMSKDFKKALNIQEDKPNDWFETLYSGSSESGEGIPWANMAAHPVFKPWIDEQPDAEPGKKALVVGCGMGDDAIELEAKGYEVTAFDVSQSAIDLCKKRFPNSTVDFVQADLIAGIPEWKNKFDLVLEIFTIQALPPKYEDILITNLSDFVADEGRIIVITEVQKQKRDYEFGPPWLLNDSYIASFENTGLQNICLNKDGEAQMGDEIHLSIFKR